MIVESEHKYRRTIPLLRLGRHWNDKRFAFILTDKQGQFSILHAPKSLGDR